MFSESCLLEAARWAGPYTPAFSSAALGARIHALSMTPPAWRRPGEEGDAPLEALRRLPGGALWDMLVLPHASNDVHAPCVLLVPPMSGHHPTLLRDQLLDLHPHAHVAVVGWKPPGAIPARLGAWGVEDQVSAIIEAGRAAKVLWPERPVHAVAVCQPVPELLAAGAHALGMGERLWESLTLMGGPVDVQANPTDVVRVGASLPLSYARWGLCRPLWSGVGIGRWVYPGSTQLAAFMSMNPERHKSAFGERIRQAPWSDATSTPFTRFYDEYLSVVDLPAEFYVETLDRVFQKRDLMHRRFRFGGSVVDTDLLADVPLAVVEGERDDICAPGQCAAALDLIPERAERMLWVAPGVGHYGVFSGRVWRTQTLGKLLDFWRSVERPSQA